MSDVLMKLPVLARGKMATKLLEAAEELGLQPGVIRSQSEGFRVPEDVHRYLFPSMYEDRDEGDSAPLTVLHGDAPATDLDPPVTDNDPAKDFGDLSDSELEKLTDPAKASE